MTETETRARSAMAKRGLRPLEHPLGEDHHTDRPFAEEDTEVGELAYWLGGLFVDKQGYDSRTPIGETYYYNEMTSEDVWRRVARALRIHGLKIVNRDS